MWSRERTPEPERRMSHDEWADWLHEPGQKLTLTEFIACELAVIHLLFERVQCGLGLDAINENGTGGYFEQLRNLLDRFVGAVTVPRPMPQHPPRETMNGQTMPVRLLRPGEQSPPQEGA